MHLVIYGMRKEETPSVKEEMFVGEKFRTFPRKPFVRNLISYLRDDWTRSCAHAHAAASRWAQKKISYGI